MIARFFHEQPVVRLTMYGDTVSLWICIGGQEIDDVIDMPDGAEIPVKYWEYDYNEFSATLTELDILDVLAHPENYSDYSGI